MRVEILCFATTREAVGTAKLALEIPAGATVESVLATLAVRHPLLAPLVPSLRVAVDEDFATPATVLHAGATLALLPPVSGG